MDHGPDTMAVLMAGCPCLSLGAFKAGSAIYSPSSLPCSPWVTPAGGSDPVVLIYMSLFTLALHLCPTFVVMGDESFVSQPIWVPC